MPNNLAISLYERPPSSQRRNASLSTASQKSQRFVDVNSNFLCGRRLSNRVRARVCPSSLAVLLPSEVKEDIARNTEHPRTFPLARLVALGTAHDSQVRFLQKVVGYICPTGGPSQVPSHGRAIVLEEACGEFARIRRRSHHMKI